MRMSSELGLLCYYALALALNLLIRALCMLTAEHIGHGSFAVS